jgi:Tfp pilus assembly protein PilO
VKARLKNKWGKLSPGRRLLALVAALALVAVGGHTLLVRPKQAEAKRLDEQLAELQTELIVRTSTAAAASDAPVIRAADLFRLAKAMPDEVDMPGVVLQLNEVAAEAGIVFKAITPSAPTPAEGYQVLPVELQFEGDFYGLSDFLYRLRNLVRVRDGGLDASGRLFSVQSLSFAESDERFPQILASLTVNAFVFGTETPPTAALPAPAETETTDAAEATG